jgi:hypothetical protein
LVMRLATLVTSLQALDRQNCVQLLMQPKSVQRHIQTQTAYVYPMSLWLPCGLLGFAEPITASVSVTVW